MKQGRLPDEGALRDMAAVLAHRGPEGEGVWMAPGVGLAHRRLAIIDVSPRGAQPMLDRSGRCAVTFNGEIYNYRDLRHELGAAWKTESDTEVILEGYRRWGKGVLLRLRGMFAFALWDDERGELLLARDRIGKKPLYYMKDNEGNLLFASEMKALIAHRAPRVDWKAVRTFLGLQYVPSPSTGFEDVFQLEPGCHAVWNGKDLKIERYHAWQRQIVERTPEQLDGDIVRHLQEAVKIRQLAADVPVGAFLSGGIDSAAVVAFASKEAGSPLQTFTMGFGIKAFDERAEARFIAKMFGTEHYEFEAQPEDLLRLVDRLTLTYDAPFADSSALPLWLLAEQTAKQVKVVLTGDGGDELFGGYRRYSAYATALRMMTVPFASHMIPELSRRVGALFHDLRYERMAETIRALGSRPETAYGELFCDSYVATRRLHELCRHEFLEQTIEADAVAFVARHMTEETSLEAAMFFDLTSYLADDLNAKMDRATMRFGLEARAPFLDQELVQYALTIPSAQKVTSRKTKIALRRALRGIVPDAIIDLPKRGFQVPLDEWFRGPLNSMLRERCLDPSSSLLQFCVRPEAMRNLIEEHERGMNHGNRLWMMLVLSTWLSRYAR